MAQRVFWVVRVFPFSKQLLHTPAENPDMTKQSLVRSFMLALLVPAIFSLSCGLKRNWDVCATNAPCKEGFTCTADWRCIRTPDGGLDSAPALDGLGPAGRQDMAAVELDVAGPMDIGAADRALLDTASSDLPVSNATDLPMPGTGGMIGTDGGGSGGTSGLGSVAGTGGSGASASGGGSSGAGGITSTGGDGGKATGGATGTAGDSGGSSGAGGITSTGGNGGKATGGATGTDGGSVGGTTGAGGLTGIGGSGGQATGGATCQPKRRDCTSSLDNDCNGTPDNQETAYCKCKAGTAQECDRPAEAGTGICKAGSQSCTVSGDKTTSDWSSCSGAVTAKTRDCTSALDDDCNGTPDNQETVYCACKVGATQSCRGDSTSPPTGICRYGTQTCTASSDRLTSNWGTTCPGAVGPQTRDCTSSLDNDCNGTPDNQDCYGTTIIAGTVTCGGGSGKKQCDTAGGCGWTPRVDNPAGSCGNPGGGKYWMNCDGPNDCPGGVCCSHFNGFSSGGVNCYPGNQSGIGGCPPDDSETYGLVCDPLDDKCPSGYHCEAHPTYPTSYWAECVRN
jgi:hypothetical protein